MISYEMNLKSRMGCCPKEDEAKASPSENSLHEEWSMDNTGT